MPCYEVNEMTIKTFNLKSEEILLEALKALNFTVVRQSNRIRAYTPNGRSTFTFDLNEQSVKYPVTETDLFAKIKRQYSAQVIQKVAKKKNWMLKKLSENKFKATKF